MAPRLRAAEKVERDAQIVADRARGLTVPTIAGRHGLSEGHVWEILAERRRQQISIASVDPTAAVMEMLDQFENRIEALALLAESARHEAVQLGAIKAQLLAMRQRFELMQAIGLLPNDLGVVAYELDVRQAVDVISEFLREHRIPKDDIADLITRLHSSTEVPRDQAAA